MHRKTRVLVVDDDPLNLRLVEAILTPAHYEVILARNGDEAVAALAKQKADIAILDIMMPGMDGIEVCRRLRTDLGMANLPVVFLTALGDRESRLKAKAAGGNDFLTKPYDEEELLARLRTLLEIKAWRRTTEDVIQRLCRAAEFRDNRSGRHVERMSRICSLLGKALGLTADDCETLKLASAMHDIGKVGTPDSILFKPGPLTKAEFAVAKEHTSQGHDMLAGSDECELLDLAATIALTHHERVDGTGYPQGLARNRIPLAGRIAAVADVFDTVSSDRPYKRGVSAEEALSIVETGGGSQFDREVTTAIVDRFDEVLAIKRSLHD
ncbi:response regulator [bacterium]|nr:response regulator [bacterium]